MGSALATEDRDTRPPRYAARQVKVMIIDDSITARSALARTVAGHPDLNVVATAGSAEIGLGVLAEHRVDVILLDLEMPGIGGLKALPQLLERSDGAKVLVVSTLTTDGAEPTLAALAMGAADTLAKPSAGNFDDAYKSELLDKVIALARGRGRPIAAPPQERATAKAVVSRPGLIAIGASTGGIHALGRFFSTLPGTIDAPILITQHLPGSFMEVFARQVSTMAGRDAMVATEGMIIRPRTIYVAPGNGHLKLRPHGDEVRVAIEKSKAPSGCCPSVDPMLESVAELYGRHGLAVILSGMGRDGALGARRLNQAGGTIVAQDEASCAVFGMPRGIVEAGIASAIAAPEGLAEFVSDNVKRKGRGLSWT